MVKKMTRILPFLLLALSTTLQVQSQSTEERVQEALRNKIEAMTAKQAAATTSTNSTVNASTAVGQSAEEVVREAYQQKLDAIARKKVGTTKTTDTTPEKGKGMKTPFTEGNKNSADKGKKSTTTKNGPKESGRKKKKKTLPPTLSPAPTSFTFSPAPTFMETGTFGPTPSTNARCTPTVGPCISTESALIAALKMLTSGNTVALCGGNGATITTKAALVIDAAETRLCCAGSSCVVKSTGNDSNLVVAGDSVTIQDITFMDGESARNGGNVEIIGAGNHRIIGSSFRNGISDMSGGNLFINTPGTVTVEGSSFIDGTANIGGGGLAVQGASAITVLTSEFMGNMAPQGGAYYSTRGSDVSTGQMITIANSEFIGNSGDIGGALLVSELGDMPTLSILNTEFTENTAMIDAGVGAIGEYLDNLKLVLQNTRGRDNVGGPLCNGFAIFESMEAEPKCIEIAEDYSNY